MGYFLLGVVATVVGGGVGLWALSAWVFNTPEDVAQAQHDRETRILQRHPPHE